MGAKKTNSQRSRENRAKLSKSNTTNYSDERNHSAPRTYSNSERSRMNRLKTTINFDTFETDLKNTASTIDSIYGGWQSAETMNSTKTTIQGMYNRINAYNDYVKIHGIKDAPDLAELSANYKSILDNWDDLAGVYSGYKDADSYNYEMSTLNKLNSMTSKDIEPYLNTKSNGPTFANPHTKSESELYGDVDNTIAYYDEDGKPVTMGALKTEQNEFADTPSIAYTTVDGQNITWQQLYDKVKTKEDHDALYKEVTSNVDFDKYKDLGVNDKRMNAVKFATENKGGYYEEYTDPVYTAINDEEL